MSIKNLQLPKGLECEIDYSLVEPVGVILPKVNLGKKVEDELQLGENYDSETAILCLSRIGWVGKGVAKLNNKDVYVKRLMYEIDMLKRLDFLDYILLNWQIISSAKKNNIGVGKGRGSSCGSLLLYLLDVTDIDPIKHGLIFERFVSEARAKKIKGPDGIVYLDGSLLPDVDNDIDFFERKNVIDFIYKEHTGKTAKILTYNTFSAKVLLREGSKFFLNYSEEEANKLTSMVPKNHGLVANLTNSIKESEVFNDWCKNEGKSIIRDLMKIEGLRRNYGVHPSGIAISNREIDEICPLQRTKDGDIVTAYDMNDVASMMVKFDILGLRTLSLCDMVASMVGIDLDDIDYEDPFIYECLQKDDIQPYGLFQISAHTNFRVSKDVKPKDINELSDVVALARPGALDHLGSYVKNDRGSLFDNKEWNEILGATRNVILFQEQLMSLSNKVFGLTLNDAETLRTIIGKKIVDKMPEWEKIIYDKAEELNLEKGIAEAYWKSLNDSAHYSFNKCLSLDTSVESETGTKTMRDIEIGEKIMGYDISLDEDVLVEVTDIIIGEKDLFEFTMLDGSAVKCSMDHKFLCSNDNIMRSISDIITNFMPIKSAHGVTKIASLEHVGVRETIDFEVNHADHNFYAEGLVTSNSHSVAYAALGATSVYLKYKYPTEFFCAALELSQYEPEPSEALASIVNELERFDIEILPPNVFKSKTVFSVEGKKQIRYGLSSIKGVSSKALEKLSNLKINVGADFNKYQMLEQATNSGVNITVVSHLILSGAFLDDKDNKKSRLYTTLEAQAWNQLTPRERKTLLESTGEKYEYDLLEHILDSVEGKHEGADFLMKKSRFETFKRNFSDYKKMYMENKKREKLAYWVFEKELVGYTYSGELRHCVEKKYQSALMSCNQRHKLEKGDDAKFIGMITGIEKFISKKGNKCLKFRLDDGTGVVYVMVTDSVNSYGKKQGMQTSAYERLSRLPENKDIAIISGKASDGDMLFLDDLKYMESEILLKKSDLKKV